MADSEAGFGVWWLSRRGAANEGTYYYGTQAQWNHFRITNDLHPARWVQVEEAKHSLEWAREGARSGVRAAARRHGTEQCWVNICNLADVMEGERWTE